MYANSALFLSLVVKRSSLPYVTHFRQVADFRCKLATILSLLSSLFSLKLLYFASTAS